MLVTLEVVQLDRLPLKWVALLNILLISVTLEVSESAKSPLNRVVPLYMLSDCPDQNTRPLDGH